MDKTYELKYHELEEKNWWFVGRRDFIVNIVKELKIDQFADILEVGCSGGPLVKSLEKNGYKNIQGIDLSEEAISLCNKRGIQNVSVMDGIKTKFTDEKFDLIIASDILEHIQDDRLALVEWYRLLKPGGRLIVFVPAFNFLWSDHDEINKHFRRYNKSLLVDKLHEVKFEILRVSYWNFFLFFPTYLIRVIQFYILKKNIKPKDQLLDLNTALNTSLIILLRFENFFLKYFNFSIGVSLFVVCKKNN